MDFDNRKVYGDTSITDGLISIATDTSDPGIGWLTSINKLYINTNINININSNINLIIYIIVRL